MTGWSLLMYILINYWCAYTNGVFYQLFCCHQHVNESILYVYLVHWDSTTYSKDVLHANTIFDNLPQNVCRQTCARINYKPCMHLPYSIFFGVVDILRDFYLHWLDCSVIFVLVQQIFFLQFIDKFKPFQKMALRHLPIIFVFYYHQIDIRIWLYINIDLSAIFIFSNKNKFSVPIARSAIIIFTDSK